MSNRSSELQRWIDRLQTGDPAARERLLECAQERLHKLACKMLEGYPGVRRWEDVDDVSQRAALKLWNALQDVQPTSVREFIGLAAVQMRRVLIDLARHYYGPQGPGRRHFTPPLGHAMPTDWSDSSQDGRKLTAWTAFHEQIDKLPDNEREVFALHWYQGLTHAEAAELLGISEHVIKRRWQAARLHLYQALGGELPPV